MLVRVLEAAAAAGAVGLAAWRLRWLRADGALAAAVVGTAVFGFGGWRGALPLLTFFVTSTLLGRLPGRGAGLRHGARDARQVFANGGPAVVAAVAAAFGAGATALVALAGSLAAANADTWATEMGTRHGGPPRAFVFGPPVEAGASGGMTVAGTLAALAGAFAIAAVAAAAGTPHTWAAGVGGVAGMLADSVLGATAQAVYRCPTCGVRVETPEHGCPTRVHLVRGWAWCGNDAVNLAATAVGAVTAVLLAVAT